MGTDPDAAACAVAMIGYWWDQVGNLLWTVVTLTCLEPLDDEATATVARVGR